MNVFTLPRPPIATPESRAGHDDALLDFLRRHDIDLFLTYRVEFGESSMLVYQFAAGDDGRPYTTGCTCNRSPFHADGCAVDIAYAEPFTVSYREPVS